MSIAEKVNMVFVTENNSVDEFSGIVETHYIRHAYMPQVHKPVKDEERSSDVYLVGTGFPERQKLLETVDWSGIDFKLHGAWVGIGEDSPLEPYYSRGFIPNAEAARWYSNAKISLNIFRRSREYGGGEISEDEAVSLSPRVYEILACGGFLLTDYRPELPDCGVFDNDLGEQLRKWLREDRSLLVEEGMKWVKPHTYQANAERILGFLRG